MPESISFVPSATHLFAYLASALCFILGLKQMSHPRTAVRGITIAAIGMAIAIIVTLLDPRIGSYGFLVFGLGAGGLIGAVLALRVDIKAMPQLVGLLNGFGGAASALVVWADLVLNENQATDALVAIGLSGLIGAVTLSGSLIAYAKLEEFKKFQKPKSLPNQPVINGLLLVVGLRAHRTDAKPIPAASNALVCTSFVGGSLVGVMLVLPSEEQICR